MDEYSEFSAKINSIGEFNMPTELAEQLIHVTWGVVGIIGLFGLSAVLNSIANLIRASKTDKVE